MSADTLEQVKSLINTLTPLEQAQLFEYLTPRIRQSLTPNPSPESREEDAEAWQTFFKIGEELSAADNPSTETLTQTLLKMRR